MLQHALVAAGFSEGDVSYTEVGAMIPLMDALFKTRAFDAVEPLLMRFRKAAKAETRKSGHLSLGEVHCLCVFARLHEVLCRCPLCVESPFKLLHPCLLQGRYHR